VSDGTSDAGVFKLERKEDPNQLLAIRAREEVCDDPTISDGAVRLFVRLLDLALNPFLNNGQRGQIIISQQKLGSMIHCDERSVRRRTDELIRANYVWTTLIGRQNTKPIRCYHISKLQPKRQVEQDMPGEGLWGNGKRRFDHGFAKTGKEATGHQRRMGSRLLDQFGNQISFNLFENTPARGQESPVSADKSDRSHRTLASSGSGQNCPLTEDAYVLSQRSKLSADSGQNCPLREDAGVRHIESQLRDSVPEGVKGAPSPQDLQFQSFVKSLEGEFRSKILRTEKDLKAKLERAQSEEARFEWKRRLQAVRDALVGGPVQDQPAKPKAGPARSAARAIQERQPTEEEILEGARYLVSSGKTNHLTNAQREALRRVGELA